MKDWMIYKKIQEANRFACLSLTSIILSVITGSLEAPFGNKSFLSGNFIKRKKVPA